MIEFYNLTNKENYLLKKEQKEKEHQKYLRKRKLKKILWLTIGALIVGGGLSALILFISNQPKISESEIISRNGLHWHSEVNVKILGEVQNIPANVGMIPVERYLHTHEPNNVIHMEFPGQVLKNDLKLNQFFKIWGKTFNKDCIFDKCSGSEGKVKMLVNGKENFEFENYVMRDGDKIEITFE